MKMMTSHIYFLSCSLFMATACMGQVAIEWQQVYGGTGAEWSMALIQTQDQGYAIAGSTVSTDGDVTGHSGGTFNQDGWILKVDQMGDIEWQTCIGGMGSDEFKSIQEMADGSFIAVGYTESTDGEFISNHGSSDVWVVKLSAAGDVLWHYLFGGSSSEGANDVLVVEDGFVVSGESYSSDGDISMHFGSSDIWLVKLNMAGQLVWERSYGGSSLEYYGSMLLKNDSIFFVGTTASNDGDVSDNDTWVNPWLVNIDQAGNIAWEKCLFTGNEANEHINIMDKAMDGGFILAGPGDGEEPLIVKTTSNGEVEWVEIISPEHSLSSVDEVEQGNILATGTKSITINNFSQPDLALFMIDPDGEVLWEQQIGGSDTELTFARSFRVEGGYVIAAITASDDGDIIENLGSYDIWLLKLTEDHSTVTGKVFIDLDSDLLFDPDETIVPYHRVFETFSDRQAYTNADGVHELRVIDTGEYPVAADVLSYYGSVPVTHLVTLTEGIHVITGIDFAMQPVGQINDLIVQVTALTAFRPGFQAQYQINYRNIGTTEISPTLLYTIDPWLTLVSSSVPGFLINDSITWTLPELMPYEDGSIRLIVEVNESLQLGQEVNAHVKIDPGLDDASPDNNEDIHSVTVTGSYDPNDILVDRNSININDLSTTDPLDYIIRFQNTGTDTAFTVLIKNPLPENVDRTSFTFVDASHDVELDYANETNTMWFRFNNILLPDSNTNEALSHGFVRYRIQPLTDLMLGDSIQNQASIFFDFNAPIITNTAFTMIDATTGAEEERAESFRMFPNPTDGKLRLELQNTTNGMILLHDALGRRMLQEQVQGRSHQLDLSDRPRGIYMVTLRTEQGVTTQRLVLD